MANRAAKPASSAAVRFFVTAGDRHAPTNSQVAPKKMPSELQLAAMNRDTGHSINASRMGKKRPARYTAMPHRAA